MAEEKKTKSVKTTKPAVKKAAPSEKKSALEIVVYGMDGKETKTVNLPKEIFNVEASPKLLAQYVRVYLANQRQGNASTKTRGQVNASTKKIYRQKGTGRARHGSKKAPIFVGGGIVGGPQTKDHTLKMNKKQKQKALFYSLSMKAKEGAIVGVAEEFMKMEPKTKTVAAFMKTIGTDKGKTLVVVPKLESNGFMLSVRNLAKVNAVSALSINAYEVLNHQKIIFTEDAVELLKSHFTKKD